MFTSHTRCYPFDRFHLEHSQGMWIFVQKGSLELSLILSVIINLLPCEPPVYLLRRYEV